MKKAGVKVIGENEWQIEGDLVLKEGKVYVLWQPLITMTNDNTSE